MRLLAFSWLLLAGALPLLAQTPAGDAAPEADVSPPAKMAKTGVRIQFVPPPMEGTISLGIYDQAGRIVRTLHREAEIGAQDFMVDADGLITVWDGRDEAGQALPAGSYSAHGFAVGNLKIKGEAILGNDWITADDSPRIAQITELFARPDGGFGIGAKLADGSATLLAFDPAGNPSAGTGGLEAKINVREGKLWRRDGAGEHLLNIEGLGAPLAACPARDGGVWVLDREPGGTSVKQFSARGSFERHLAIEAGAPQPEQIAASPVADTIFLLERGPHEQQFRALTLIAPAPVANADPAAAPVSSTWKILFKKSISSCATLAEALPQLKMPDGSPFIAAPTAVLKLIANPLDENAALKATVAVGLESGGSVLKLADGLPLHLISATPNLRWAALAGDAEGHLVIFQSDGAAIEEFRMAQPAHLMAFDAGKIESPAAPPSASP